MPESDIGPCECCGSVCTCTLVTCTWRWSTATMPGLWNVIRSCGSATNVNDGLDKPCCGCPTPGFPGTTNGQETDVFCVQGTGSNGCNCSGCTAQYNIFTGEWVTTIPCTSGGILSRCRCVGSGTGSHGESRSFLCSC